MTIKPTIKNASPTPNRRTILPILTLISLTLHGLTSVSRLQTSYELTPQRAYSVLVDVLLQPAVPHGDGSAGRAQIDLSERICDLLSCNTELLQALSAAPSFSSDDAESFHQVAVERRAKYRSGSEEESLSLFRIRLKHARISKRNTPGVDINDNVPTSTSHRMLG